MWLSRCKRKVLENCLVCFSWRLYGYLFSSLDTNRSDLLSANRPALENVWSMTSMSVIIMLVSDRPPGSVSYQNRLFIECFLLYAQHSTRQQKLLGCKKTPSFVYTTQRNRPLKFFFHLQRYSEVNTTVYYVGLHVALFFNFLNTEV